MSASAQLVTFIETHSLVRERQFSARSVEHTIEILHMERATGKMVVNFTNGTVGSIQFEERAKLVPGR